jgi:hypothetical protein
MNTYPEENGRETREEEAGMEGIGRKMGRGRNNKIREQRPQLEIRLNLSSPFVIIASSTLVILLSSYLARCRASFPSTSLRAPPSPLLVEELWA